jgi:putative hydrolase of HD superfamily
MSSKRRETPAIRKSLLQLLFSGAYMKRWNDKLRPVELVEMDKQAHKMMTAWLLFMLSSRGMGGKERLALGRQIVEGGLYDYLFRLVITDIKPPVFYRIKENPEHFKLLSDWVLEQLKPRLLPLGQAFWKDFTAYWTEPEEPSLARNILAAAHLYASYSEFLLIKSVNSDDEELKDIEKSFKDGLARYHHLPGVDDLLSPNPGEFGRFARLCGRLRFQTRWSQTPRIPETSVLGHMFIVAAYSWFFSLELGFCQAGLQNNFFAGLFHDLPELLTRDIISPVKRSAQAIGDLIREYEERELLARVLHPLDRGGYQDIADRLRYFLGLDVGSEFRATCRVDGKTQVMGSEELQSEYNEDRLDPKDGELVKVSDALAAFIEAYTAVRNGITSDQLQEAIWRLRKAYQKSQAGGIHVGALLADFD